MIAVGRKVKSHLVKIMPLEMMPEAHHLHSEGAGTEQYQFPYTFIASDQCAGMVGRSRTNKSFSWLITRILRGQLEEKRKKSQSLA